MNKTIILGICILMAWPRLWAQSEEVKVVESDTTIISWRKKEYVIVKDEDGTHMSIQDREEERDEEGEIRHDPSEVGVFAFDLGLTNYYADGLIGTEAAVPDLALKTFKPGAHLGLHFLPTRVKLDRRGVLNLKTAITLDLNTYHFAEPITLLPNQEQLTYAKDTSLVFDKNKLTARYVQVPLMFNINTHPRTDKGLKISFGAYAGLLWNATLKQKLAGQDKTKVKDNFNLSKFRYGLMARFDFRWLDLYVNYNLSSLFEEGQGPATQTFTAGINLIDF